MTLKDLAVGWLISTLTLKSWVGGNNHISGSPRRLSRAGQACLYFAIQSNLHRRFQLLGFHYE